MILKNAKFIRSMTGAGPFPGDHLPKVAVAGKSNVGKSSLINALCNNGKLAKVSQTPGKTRLVNLFDIGGEFILVDLPGYGFAKVSKAEKETWGAMIEGFLMGTEGIGLMLHLLDIRHEPTAEDIQMSIWLRHFDIPFLAVLTKADKLSRAQQQRGIMAISRKIGLQPWEMVPFSSVTKAGRDELIKRIRKALLDEKEMNTQD